MSDCGCPSLLSSALKIDCHSPSTVLGVEVRHTKPTALEVEAARSVGFTDGGGDASRFSAAQLFARDCQCTYLEPSVLLTLSVFFVVCC